MQSYTVKFYHGSEIIGEETVEANTPESAYGKVLEGHHNALVKAESGSTTYFFKKEAITHIKVEINVSTGPYLG